jgi:hypothetical protein
VETAKMVIVYVKMVISVNIVRKSIVNKHVITMVSALQIVFNANAKRVFFQEIGILNYLKKA